MPSQRDGCYRHRQIHSESAELMNCDVCSPPRPTKFINLLSNSGFAVGTGLLSCTSEVRASNVFAYAGRRVQLLDTPGFDDTITSDREILRRIAAFLADQ